LAQRCLCKSINNPIFFYYQRLIKIDKQISKVKFEI